MSTTVIILFGLFLLFLLLVVFGTKKTISKFYLSGITFAIVLTIYWGVSGRVGKPMYVGNLQYSPFDNGKIFQTYWTSTRGNEKLFSVVEIKGHEGWTEKDTLREVYYRAEPIIKPIPELFIVFDNNFFEITEQQKNEILKVGMEPQQIKRYLWMK